MPSNPTSIAFSFLMLTSTYCKTLRVKQMPKYTCNGFYVRAVDVYEDDFLMAFWSLIRDQWLALIGIDKKESQNELAFIKNINNVFTATLPKFHYSSREISFCAMPDNLDESFYLYLCGPGYSKYCKAHSYS